MTITIDNRVVFNCLALVAGGMMLVVIAGILTLHNAQLEYDAGIRAYPNAYPRKHQCNCY